MNNYNQLKVKLICDKDSPCFSQMLEAIARDRYSITQSGHCTFCDQNLNNILEQLEETSPKLTLVK